MTPFEQVRVGECRAAGRRVGWLRLVVVEFPGARGTEVEAGRRTLMGGIRSWWLFEGIVNGWFKKFEF